MARQVKKYVKEVDYDLFCTMRDLCLELAEQAEKINDRDEDGDYRIEPYNGGIIFITQEEMEQLNQLKDM